MYIGDITFDYSGLLDYKSCFPSCKAEFSVNGSFEEMIYLQRELDRLKIVKLADILDVEYDYLLEHCKRDACMCTSCGFSGSFTADYLIKSTVKLLGCSTSVKIPPIKKVIFHDPATIVYWQDKTRTVVKCKDGETFDKEKGLAICISKKLLGDKFHSEFRKYTEDKEVEKGGAE